MPIQAYENSELGLIVSYHKLVKIVSFMLNVPYSSGSCLPLTGPWITNHAGSKYLFNESAVSHHDAQASCQSLGAALATVTSLNEQDFLYAQISR